MKPELTKYIVFAYFSGNATALQKQMIEKWLTDVQNVETYFEWLEEWEKINPQFIPETSEALRQVTEKVHQDNEIIPAYEENRVKVTSRWKTVLWAAASVLFMGFASYLGRDWLIYRTYETSFGELSRFSLEDSSTVVLNANSRLKVPRWGFGSATRQVYLEGEAEFFVQHTVDHQYFKVHTTNENVITVLGTEFVVFSRAEQTNVVLSKGKVELASYTGGKPIQMLPGDRASIQKDGKIKVEQLTETMLASYSAWKEHRFVFDDTPLKEVAAKIEEVFGIVVSIKDHVLATRTATGSFPAKNADELLTTMSYMYNFEVMKADDKIILVPNP